MDHSLIGKPSLRVVLVMGLLIGLCSLLLLAACGGEEAAKGGAGQENTLEPVPERSPNHTTMSLENDKKSARSFAGTASTDGLIAFFRRDAIFTMYPNGSHIRQITHPPEGWSDGSPAWSPDGTKVAFHRGCRRSHCHGSRILVVDVNTGVTRSVTHCIPNRGWTKEHPPPSSAPYCVADSQPAFSPDGKLMVFERVRVADDRHAVFVQSLASSGSPEDARQITPWEMYCGDGPEFSPNANWVLFGCEPEGEAIEELYWVHPNGTGLYRLTYAPDDVHYEGSSFSPEFKGWGDIVAVRWPAYGDYDNSDVFRMHIEASDVQSEVTVNLTKSQTLDDAPSWGTYPPSARQ